MHVNACKTKILVLAASPENLARLRLNEEVREIDAGLRRAKHRERFQLDHRSAVRPLDLQQALLDVEPHIVHFCGHGVGAEGLILEDDNGMAQPVQTPALANLFRLFAHKIECVVLNSCHTEHQAKAIAEHVPFVIGMKREIGDRAAIKFAIGFYCALGAGRAIESAYHLGRSAIELENLPDHLIPTLLPERPNRTDLRGQLPQPQEAASYSTLSKMSREEAQILLRECKNTLAEQPESWRSHFDLGLIYLHLKMYDLATRHFKCTIELAPTFADAYFYLGLASIRGRRPKLMDLLEIRKIEEHLTKAIALDDRPAKFYYFAGILKYDFYAANGLGTSLPLSPEIFQMAATKDYDRWEIERLLASVPLQDRRLLGLVRRQL